MQFMHITTPKKGGLTLALCRTELEGGIVQYEVGAAFASPSERQFDRKKGRLIAEGRLMARRNGYTCFTRNERDKKESITKEEILTYLPYKMRTPSRRRDDRLGPDWLDAFFEDIEGCWSDALSEGVGR